MKRPLDTTPAPARGSILPGEVLPMREAGRRLGLAKQALIDCQRAGLRTVTIGRLKFTTGDWVRQFVEAQAQQQAGGNGGPEA
jgi:hypothetical protein